MCGIIGYTGNDKAGEILITGLKRLEYRGYDSSGIALLGKTINCFKYEGKVKILDENLTKKSPPETVGIGHTRWATHGEPSDINSHPHLSNGGKIALVHNGIIENYMELKSFLCNEGYDFFSETDTEVAVNLIEYYYKKHNNLVEAIRIATKEMVGHFSFGIICEDLPETILGIRRQNPLVVGIGKDCNFIASDFTPALEHTKDFYLLDEEEIVVINKTDIRILNEENKEVNKDVYHVDWGIESAEKSGYEHFMLKEIFDQPNAVRDTIHANINKTLLDEDYIKKISKIHIVACGSALHAGFAAKRIIERLAKIPAECYYASEFRYQLPLLSKNDLCIIISQSGETADTLAALREARKNGVKTLSVVNVRGSTIARETDVCMYIQAGVEIAVATTKAYSAQLAALYIIAVNLAKNRGLLEKAHEDKLHKELLGLPGKIEFLLTQAEEIKELAEKYSKSFNGFLIGRGIDYAAAMEGSLKLKEISYIHSEAYPAGEMKHGTISLIENGTLVIAVITQSNVAEKTFSNLQETVARGASCFIITTEALKNQHSDYPTVIIPETDEYFMASLIAVPLQFFAYYSALLRNCDIDMPRNLAKSVTVE